MPRKGAAKKGYHHGDLRQAVLDAAIGLIERRGVSHLNMREIARKAGVSHGAPYHHFAGRAALLAAIAEESFQKLAQALRDAVARATPDPRARFEASGRAYVAFALQHPARFRVMFRPELADPEHHPNVERESALALQVLVDLVAECQRAGLAPGFDRAALVLTTWSTAHGFAALWVDGPLSRGTSAFPGGPEQLSMMVARTLGALLS